MKRFLSIVMIILILSTSVTAYANIGEKLDNHWSKGMIEREFVAYYFPYLARNNFENLNPNEPILKKDFILSLASLAKDYDLNVNTDNLGIYGSLTRKEIVDLIGTKLSSLKGLNRRNKELPFKDINTMNIESIELLSLLYDLGIIAGVSQTSFAPDNKLSQAEAIIILQRVKGVLEGMREVSFNVRGIVQSYNNEESVFVKEEDNKVLVTLTKEFPTPGYGMDVKKIVNEGDQYKIYLDIKPPREGTMQLQVITYKTMTIELDKRDLKLDPPYVFSVEGIESNLIK